MVRPCAGPGESPMVCCIKDDDIIGKPLVIPMVPPMVGPWVRAIISAVGYRKDQVKDTWSDPWFSELFINLSFLEPMVLYMVAPWKNYMI